MQLSELTAVEMERRQRDFLRREVLKGVRQIAENWTSPLMDKHLEGVESLAVYLLIDAASGVYPDEAERVVKEAIELGKSERSPAVSHAVLEQRQ